jgi:hypothetical protein
VKDSFYEELERVFDKFTLTPHENSVLSFQWRRRQGRLFKPTIGNKSLHETSNDNAVRLVNFATSKNIKVKITMFPHSNIHKCTWTFPNGKNKQIGHILVDSRRHSNVLDIRSFREADCDTNDYLVVANIRERLAVNK